MTFFAIINGYCSYQITIFDNLPPASKCHSTDCIYINSLSGFGKTTDNNIRWYGYKPLRGQTSSTSRRKLLFVEISHTTRKTVSNLSMQRFHIGPRTDKRSSFEKLPFLRKTNIRIGTLWEAVSAKFTVIHSDITVDFVDNTIHLLQCVNTYVAICHVY